MLIVVYILKINSKTNSPNYGKLSKKQLLILKIKKNEYLARNLFQQKEVNHELVDILSVY
jgi:hypothetical protein